MHKPTRSFRLSRAVSAALLVTLLAAFAPALARQESAPDAPPPPPSPKWERSHDYDVQHYRIAMSFDWARKAVLGETTVTVRPFADGFRRLELDAGNMAIGSVRLAGGASLTYDYKDNRKLVVALDKSTGKAIRSALHDGPGVQASARRRAVAGGSHG